MTGTGPYAEMLRIRHETTCHRLGLDKKRDNRRLDCSLFQAPAKKKETAQLSLF
jgi:hypothetical protein